MWHYARFLKKSRKPPSGRRWILDLLIAIVALASIGLVGAATFTSRLHGQMTLGQGQDVADAVAALRRTFGYDGVIHDLERLRRSADPAALAALGDGIRTSRAAIGLLRARLGDDALAARRALTELEAAGRRLETLLQAEHSELSAKIIELPLLEPLFVLEQAQETLRAALEAEDHARIQVMFWLTMAAASLLAATALLLAGWTRLSCLLPLRRLADDLAQENQAGIARMASRQDEFGMIARALGEALAPAPTGPADDLRVMLQSQERALLRTKELVEFLASSSPRTNEPEPAGPILAHGMNEPEPAALPDQPDPARSQVLHSIVEMVAREQLRRHQGERGAPAEGSSEGERLMAALVDRVLTRLDQVTERVVLQGREETRQAS